MQNHQAKEYDMRLSAIACYTGDTPDGYICDKCGAEGCKLWRNQSKYLKPGRGIRLYCKACAGKRAACINKQGKFIRVTDPAELIKKLVPATYHGCEKPDNTVEWLRHDRMPIAFVDWWNRLPLHPPSEQPTAQP